MEGKQMLEVAQAQEQINETFGISLEGTTERKYIF